MPRSRFSATREVTRKSEVEIERETALKWAARAEACFVQAERTGGAAWLQRGRDYHHEALEHGALVHDGGRLVGQIDRRLLAHLRRLRIRRNSIEVAPSGRRGRAK